MGTLVFCVSREETLAYQFNHDGEVLHDARDCGRAIRELRAGNTVFTTPALATGWGAPHDTLIVFSPAFAAQADAATQAQALARPTRRPADETASSVTDVVQAHLNKLRSMQAERPTGDPVSSYFQMDYTDRSKREVLNVEMTVLTPEQADAALTRYLAAKKVEGE